MARKQRYTIIVLFILLAIAGCATVRVRPYKGYARYPAVEPQSVEVFQKKPEGRRFIEIAEITVEGASSLAQVERIFRLKAAEYGGQAVYVYKTIEQARTYSSPHECHFYDGFFYPHGYDYPYSRFSSYRHDYFRSYHYCYGYADTETVTFLTVVGIVIRWTA